MTVPPARHFISLPTPFASCHDYIRALISFLDDYSWLWRHHAVDFYTNDYWHQGFPQEWQTTFFDNDTCTTTYNDLIQLASHGIIPKEWPSSLKEFIQTAHHLALPRNPDNIPFVNEFKVEPLDHRVMYGMTPKKRHEVELLAGWIDRMAHESNVTHIMDLGAGQGYLDACLVYQYGYTVLGVDDNTIQTCGAKRRSKVIDKYCKKDASSGQLFHINRRVHFKESFQTLIQEAQEACPTPSWNEKQHTWLLCGLHTCGDLACNLIRHFLSTEAKVMMGVGCCYNHVTEQEQGCGFPMSQFVSDLDYSIGFTGRMLACQSTCRWSTQADCIDAFLNHHYRALLQYVIRDLSLLPKDMCSKDIQIGRLPKSAFGKGFAYYAEHALKRLGIDCEKQNVTYDVLSDYEVRFKPREMQVAIAWTLRALLAGAIESLLLVDRFLYLIEAGSHPLADIQADQSVGGDRLQVMLFPLFNPVDSPRNFVVCAKKL